jgi:lysophospholipase L1-like esterase
VATAVLAGAGLAGAGVLLGQVQLARRDIPLAQAPPPRADGRYGGQYGRAPLAMVLMGDSVAAGYGAGKPRQTPGALLAVGISRSLDRPVELRVLAVVGATSRGLEPQVALARELAPDLAVIVIGGNDVTHGTHHAEAVRFLAAAVRELRVVGTRVVVGTCPDLSAIQPLRAPLRHLVGHWSRRLAAAQTAAVVAAGGWTVPLGGRLGPRFAAEPHRMFGEDRFHPSPDGYATAAAALLPTVLAALAAPATPGPATPGPAAPGPAGTVLDDLEAR